MWPLGDNSRHLPILRADQLFSFHKHIQHSLYRYWFLRNIVHYHSSQQIAHPSSILKKKKCSKNTMLVLYCKYINYSHAFKLSFLYFKCTETKFLRRIGRRCVFKRIMMTKQVDDFILLTTFFNIRAYTTYMWYVHYIPHKTLSLRHLTSAALQIKHHTDTILPYRDK